MMNTLFSRLLGLDARSVVESWTLRFRSDWPLFLLALGVLAALVGAFFLYRRETVLGRVGRILMMLARTLGVAVVLVMLFRPTAEVRIRQTVKPTALLLVDDSASMDIRDTRKEIAPLTDAAMALGKLPYDSPDLSRAVVRSRRAMEAAAVALESGKADPAREALAAVTEALADVRRAAENRSPDVAASLMAAFDELAARQDRRSPAISRPPTPTWERSPAGSGPCRSTCSSGRNRPSTAASRSPKNLPPKWRRCRGASSCSSRCRSRRGRFCRT
jgi:hypothetical protein